jgi:adenosine deaminase
MEALPYKGWIIGVGLDSDERGNPPNKFAQVYARAKQEGFLTTMHCDVDQENTVDHLRQCLDEIGVDRIDHGVNSLDDPELVDQIISRGMGLTVCPISNQYVVQSLKAEQIKQMLDKRMRVTVNSDDPAYFNGYMNENLIAVQQAVGLSEAELKQLMINAFEVSWLDGKKKQHYIDMVNAYMGA